MTKPHAESDRKEPAYPYYPLKRTLEELAQSVRDCGGARNYVPKTVLAHRMKLGKNSGPLNQMLASAKCFGMIEGSRAYMLTEAGKRYFLPTNDTEKREALLGFLRTPPVFKFLIQRFDGDTLPDSGMLANLLTHEGKVAESWANRVAGIFKSAGRDLGVIDKDGRLGYSVVAHEAGLRDQGERSELDEERETETETEPIEKQKPAIQMRPAELAQALAQGQVKVRVGVNVWVYNEEGGTVRVETSDPLSFALWERLMRYVEVLRPSSGTRKEGANGKGEARRGSDRPRAAR